jgi:hypothetical protein
MATLARDTVAVTPFPGPIGADVSGLDLASLDDAAFAVVKRAWLAHKVLRFRGQRLDDEAWKDMATAALKRQRVVPGIDGGFVVLGTRTSRMTIGEMSELIDFLHAFGDERGVKWSRTSLGRDVPEEAFA